MTNRQYPRSMLCQQSPFKPVSEGYLDGFYILLKGRILDFIDYVLFFLILLFQIIVTLTFLYIYFVMYLDK